MTLREKLQKAMDYPWCVFFTRRTRWVEKPTFVAPMPGETLEWEGAARSRETDYQSKNSVNDCAAEDTRVKTPTS